MIAHSDCIAPVASLSARNMARKGFVAILEDAVTASTLVSQNILIYLLSDLFSCLSQVAKSTWQRSITAWVYVPFGVTCILAICFGIHSLISISSVSFPASVAAMIGLFVLLILSQVTLGDRKTKKILALVDIPVSVVQCFCLRT